MYSQKIINNSLEFFEQENGWLPVYHSYGEVLEFTKYVDSLIKIESNSKSSYINLVKKISASRQVEIRRWIQNEQALCSMDNNYWTKNYAWVADEKGQIFKFSPRKSQQVFDSVIAGFDEDQVSIEILCLDPETKVLTADLHWVRLDDIKVGDEIVAVDEGETLEQRKLKHAASYQAKKNGTYEPRVKGQKKNLSERKMRTTIVEAKWDTFGAAVEILFEDGRKIVCSPNHKFLSKARGGVEPTWYEARDLGVGSEVRSITKPWNEPAYEDGWFGGFIDGEGCMSKHSEPGTDVCVAQRFNVALDRARDYLKKRGYAYREEVDTRSVTPNGKQGKDPVAKLSVSRSDELFRLMGQTRPSRFINRRWWEGKCLPGKRSAATNTWAKIISVRIIPDQRLIDIQTSTGTFIAEGLVTHNCLKGRQVGITTCVALKFIHRMLFIPHTQAVMASVQRDKSDLIERMLNTAYTRCPWWLVPRRLPKKSFDNGSILSIQSGMQATGIAQGWTPQLIHISEVSLIPNPKETIEEGLLPATHSSKNLFMVFEGTGSGNVGWFPDYWRDSKKKWPLNQSRMCPIFISWPLATDLYPQEDWLRKFPVPGGFLNNRLDATKKHIARCESYIRNTPYLSRIVGKDYQMPVEQQHFWEFEYRQAKEKHTLQKFAARMPADDFEALTGIHDSVFDIEVLAELEENIYNVITVGDNEIKERRLPVQAYAIVGHDVDECFHPDPDSLDRTKESIKVEWKSFRGNEYEWTLIPLKDQDETFETNTMDRLMVYDPPQRGYYYAMGVDTADGLGKEDEDRAVLSITNNRFNGESDQQCAEFTTNKVNSAQIVAFAACIGAWYGKGSPDGRGMKYAIEQIRGPGDTCQHQLKMMGFNNHHKPRRYDGKKIKENPGSKEGWYSNGWSVPMLMSRFQEAVNGGWYSPKSKWLIEELRTLERHETGGKSKMEHRSGQHDDRVRAAAVSYFTAHDFDILTERAQKRSAPPAKREKPKGPGSANQMSVSDGW
jgi:hypothetical protein